MQDYIPSPSFLATPDDSVPLRSHLHIRLKLLHRGEAPGMSLFYHTDKSIVSILDAPQTGKLDQNAVVED
jgi:hypothetical protein